MLGKRFETEEQIFQGRGRWIDGEQLNNLLYINRQTNESLDRMQTIFEQYGAKVYRPNLDYCEETVIVAANQFYVPDPGSCRDWCFAYGDEVTIYPSSVISRSLEYKFWKDTFLDMMDNGKVVRQVPFFWDTQYDTWQKFEKMSKDEIEELLKEALVELENEVIVKDRPVDIVGKHFLQNVRNGLKFFGSRDKKKYEAIYHYVFSTTHKDNCLFHPASCFKHNDSIIHTMMGSRRGLNQFFSSLININKNIQFHSIRPEMAHCDGDSVIVDKDLVLIGADGGGSIDVEEIDHPMYNKLGMQVLLVSGYTFGKSFKKTRQDINLLTDARMDYYWKTIHGYEQDAYFDLNGIALAPRVLLGNFLNTEVIDMLAKWDIEVINEPMAYRWILDGGIHCYTNDIDREHL